MSVMKIDINDSDISEHSKAERKESESAPVKEEKKVEPPKEEPKPKPEPEKKGCKGSIIAISSLTASLGLLGTGLIIYKKKKESER